MKTKLISGLALLLFACKADSISDKLAKGTLIDNSELVEIGIDDLSYLRYELYARRGFAFSEKYYQDTFKTTQWYKPLSSNYKVKLSSVDSANYNLLGEVLMQKKRAAGLDSDDVNTEMDLLYGPYPDFKICARNVFKQIQKDARADTLMIFYGRTDATSALNKWISQLDFQEVYTTNMQFDQDYMEEQEIGVDALLDRNKEVPYPDQLFFSILKEDSLMVFQFNNRYLVGEEGYEQVYQFKYGMTNDCGYTYLGIAE